MTMTYRALSALLSYPTDDLVAALPEIRAALRRERLIPAAELRALDAVIDDMESRDLYDVQERYVELFDRSRSLSLHLFEHIHGESRDRGQAMVDLAELYRSRGITATAGELPDFLPLFLEFLSLVEPAEAKKLLTDAAHIVLVLQERLARRQSPYAHVLAAVAALAEARVLPADRSSATDAAAPADDLAALDAEWEEAAVTFGSGDAMSEACGRSRLMTRLRAATRSVVDAGRR